MYVGPYTVAALREALRHWIKTGDHLEFRGRIVDAVEGHSPLDRHIRVRFDDPSEARAFRSAFEPRRSA